jgi:serine protease AprX
MYRSSRGARPRQHVITVAAGATDLDLIVKAGGQERHGNMPAGSTDFGRTNNLEQVAWNNVSAGSVTVVSAHKVTLAPQKFALVIRVL